MNCRDSIWVQTRSSSGRSRSVQRSVELPIQRTRVTRDVFHNEAIINVGFIIFISVLNFSQCKGSKGELKCIFIVFIL